MFFMSIPSSAYSFQLVKVESSVLHHAKIICVTWYVHFTQSALVSRKSDEEL